MNYVDVVLLAVLGSFVLAGFWFGVIHMIGSLVGLGVGIWAAGHYYQWAADWLTYWGLDNVNLARVLGFLLVFVLVNRLFGLVVLLADKVFKVISIIPFLKTFNRLLGAGLGLIEGTIVLALTVWFVGRFPLTAAFAPRLAESELAQSLNVIGQLLAPLLPEALRLMKSVIV